MTLSDRLRAALREPDRPLLSGDLDGNVPVPAAGWRAAAVLIAVTDRVEPGILLTLRTKTLRNHAGQVAFPGGSIDPGDRDAVAAALREAEEEIALPPAAVNVIGPVDRYRTVTGFEVVPVLGVIAPDLPVTPHPREVDSIFEVPLSFALDPANHTVGSRWHDGHERRYYELHFAGRHIWGATAAMIVNLSRRLKWP